jgi:hypothetical protein
MELISTYIRLWRAKVSRAAANFYIIKIGQK